MVSIAESVASCKVTASLAAEVALAIGTLLLLQCCYSELNADNQSEVAVSRGQMSLQAEAAVGTYIQCEVVCAFMKLQQRSFCGCILYLACTPIWSPGRPL